MSDHVPIGYPASKRGILPPITAGSLCHSPHAFFLFMYGAFGASHWISYTFEWTSASVFTHTIGLAGLTLALFPLSRSPFVVLTGALVVDAVIQAPVFSNHTMLKNFLLLAIGLAAVETMVRRESWTFFMQRFAPAGRWLLIGMYFYGVFHKINAGFLDPEVSCATALWQTMPFPALVTDNVFFHVAGIWGTFIIEGAIVLLLLVRHTRHLGIFFGIGFHALLALSGYAYYPTFSTLTIALHCLFLPAWAHVRLAESPPAMQVLNRLRTPAGLVMIGLVAGAITFYAVLEMFVSAALGWLLVVTPFALLVLRFGREPPTGKEWPNELRIVPSPVLAFRPSWVPLVALLFLFNGATPYLGLKTAQSFNMFANLRLEGGVSNHLILSRQPGPFQYLEQVVEITASTGVPWFTYIQTNDLRIVYYDLLDRMERAGPGARVSYRLNNMNHIDRSQSDLQPEFDRVLHPRWFRAWFHFIPVDLTHPKPCALDR